MEAKHHHRDHYHHHHYHDGYLDDFAMYQGRLPKKWLGLEALLRGQSIIIVVTIIIIIVITILTITLVTSALV